MDGVNEMPMLTVDIKLSKMIKARLQDTNTTEYNQTCCAELYFMSKIINIEQKNHTARAYFLQFFNQTFKTNRTIIYSEY